LILSFYFLGRELDVLWKNRKRIEKEDVYTTRIMVNVHVIMTLMI